MTVASAPNLDVSGQAGPRTVWVWLTSGSKKLADFDDFEPLSRRYSVTVPVAEYGKKRLPGPQPKERK